MMGNKSLYKYIKNYDGGDISFGDKSKCKLLGFKRIDM